MSPALQAIETANGHEVPTAMIAGQVTQRNLSGLDHSIVAWAIRKKLCNNDPLAQNFTSTGWPTIMGGDSDGMVPVTSKLNSLSGYLAMEKVHSAGLERLGFNGPKELDPNDQTNVPSAVIQLLNAPSDSSYFYKLP